MKRKIKIVDLIRAEGREPGGCSGYTAWVGTWGKSLRRLPDSAKSHGLTLIELARRVDSPDYKMIAKVFCANNEMRKALHE